jgi:hypothetical protein
MKTAQPIKEIRGTPGQILGNVVVPIGGKMLMKLNGDLLQTQTHLSWELEYEEIDIRLNKITSISMTEGRIWWLLWFGFLTIFGFIGVIFIIAFFLIKQRWIIINTGGEKIVLFFRQQDAQNVKLFRQTTLTLARQPSFPGLPPASPPRKT